jgi:lipoprotein NlpI
MWRNLFTVLAALGCVAGVARADDPDEVLKEASKALSARDYEKALGLADRVIADAPRNPQAHFVRGVAAFKLGKIDDSITAFEKVAELKKGSRAELWQLGIAYYYAGRFEDGYKLFELHRTVNPEDVENAAWHFLCLARAKTIDEARKNLIPVKADSRVPMAEVQKLFAGEIKPEDVMKAAEAGKVSDEERNRRLFYGHLYVGLYYEATGDAAKAKEHLTAAYKDHKVPDYMWDVARIHVERLAKKEK